MAQPIYSAITSLDGYIEDESSGRRMYEVMIFWETEQALAEQPSFVQDYAKIWRAADKIVYSRTLRRRNPAPGPESSGTSILTRFGS